jgi:DNA-binding transcriptional LysR family regulator
MQREARVCSAPLQFIVPGAQPIAPGQFSILWPSSRQLSPKLRVFLDFFSEYLFSER